MTVVRGGEGRLRRSKRRSHRHVIKAFVVAA
jgi:hypothetical protein